jgi:hypothetical protein
MAKTNLSIVQEAIEIQGYITVNVANRDREAHKVQAAADGTWITDILTSDLQGYVRIKKTKAAVVAQAKQIIANKDQILAAREAARRRANEWMMNS